MSINNIIILFVIGLFNFNLLAANIYTIESKYLTILASQEKMHYRGNVVLTASNFIINSSELEFIKKTREDLMRFTNLTIIQLSKDKKQKLTISGDKAEYFIKGKFIITGNVKFSDGENSIQAQKITYNSVNRTIEAVQVQDKQVKVVIKANE
ncbi:MAG: LptA/OstA family protein [Methylacidiphilales bacterium]|nr:LptA/OstA family protein [Candidatus Methylacidiphilales bacterium]